MDEKKLIVCNGHENIDDSDEAINKCNKWLDNCVLSDCDSICDGTNYSDITDITTTTDTSSAMESGLVFRNQGVTFSNEIVGNENIPVSVNVQQIVNKEPNIYENIQIYKSKKVHIGDVTHINGPVYINQAISTLNQQIIVNHSDANKNVSGGFPLITRRNWLAQPPIEEREFLSEPAKYVIIIHSATEEGFTQADNTLLVRLIQTFHIESRKWSDISYNFLVGADGCVFEGRGWGVIGAHSHAYNKMSVGICFIGCYVQHLPPPIAIRRAKALIRQGVETGAIAKDYKLLAHCQCSSTESPGKTLFQEIQTWDNWDGSVSVANPSPLIKL